MSDPDPILLLGDEQVEAQKRMLARDVRSLIAEAVENEGEIRLMYACGRYLWDVKVSVVGQPDHLG